MKRELALAATAWAMVGPAAAAMSPEVYEAARRDASDVIVIAVAGVASPEGAAAYGDCQVTGMILAVERGSRYRVGDPVSLAVACAEPDADYPDGGAIYERMEELLASTYGRAFLAPDGTIALDQYDQLSEADLP